MVRAMAVASAAALLAAAASIAVVAARASPAVSVSVSVDTSTVVSMTDPGFKCWNIDASPNRGFFWRNLTSPNLLQLAAGCPAGYLRFGGSGNDMLWYGDGIGSNTCAEGEKRGFGCLNATHAAGLLALSDAASANLVFALNIRNTSGHPSGKWDATNAQAMMTWLAARNQPWAYELGNEENYFLSGSQEAEDFLTLQGLIEELYPDKSSRPRIVGADSHGLHVNPPKQTSLDWISDFVTSAGKNKLDLHGLTHHEYIEVGYNGTAWTSLDPAVLDVTSGIAAALNKTVRSAAAGHLPDLQVWAGEIGPHNGGSPPCDPSSRRWANFADSFWYVDAMAAKALHGYQVFCRQDFIGADYGLLDCPTQTPTPDYWSSVLFSRVVGTTVLRASVSGSSFVRAYSHCSKDNKGMAAVILLNLLNSTVQVSVDAGSTTSAPLGDSLRMEYHLSATDGLAGLGVALNGKPLEWTVNHAFPSLAAQEVDAANPVAMAPESIAFVEMPAAGVCA